MNILKWFQDSFIGPGRIATTLSAFSVRLELEQPNLFVGKIIGNDELRCKVVELIGSEFIVVEVLSLTRFDNYLDCGKTYTLFKRDVTFPSKMLIWEFKPESMKRQTGQLLLFWDREIGWIFELDD